MNHISSTRIFILAVAVLTAINFVNINNVESDIYVNKYFEEDVQNYLSTTYKSIIFSTVYLFISYTMLYVFTCG